MTLAVLPLRAPAPLDELHAASTGVSEATLFRGYGVETGGHVGLPIERPCACGESIVLGPDESIERVYALHVRQPAHRSWSDANRWR